MVDEDDRARLAQIVVRPEANDAALGLRKPLGKTEDRTDAVGQDAHHFTHAAPCALLES